MSTTMIGRPILHSRRGRALPFTNNLLAGYAPSKCREFQAAAWIERLGGTAFTWTRENLGNRGAFRDRYITSLKSADTHDVQPLLAFARS